MRRGIVTSRPVDRRLWKWARRRRLVPHESPRGAATATAGSWGSVGSGLGPIFTFGAPSVGAALVPGPSWRPALLRLRSTGRHAWFRMQWPGTRPSSPGFKKTMGLHFTHGNSLIFIRGTTASFIKKIDTAFLPDASGVWVLSQPSTSSFIIESMSLYQNHIHDSGLAQLVNFVPFCEVVSTKYPSSANIRYLLRKSKLWSGEIFFVLNF